MRWKRITSISLIAALALLVLTSLQFQDISQGAYELASSPLLDWTLVKMVTGLIHYLIFTLFLVILFRIREISSLLPRTPVRIPVSRRAPPFN